jgi:hypothetical protein
MIERNNLICDSILPKRYSRIINIIRRYKIKMNLIWFLLHDLNWHYLLFRRFLSINKFIVSIEFHLHTSGHIIIYSEWFIRRYGNQFCITGITKMTTKNLWWRIQVVNTKIGSAPITWITNYKINMMCRTIFSFIKFKTWRDYGFLK